MLKPEVIEYIDGDATIFEQSRCAGSRRKGSSTRFNHRGFWQAMDTLRERQALEHMWDKGRAPWKVWA